MFLVFIPGCLHKLYWLQYLICFLSNGDFTRRCLKLNSVKIPHHSPLSKLTRALSHTHTHNQAHKKPAFCRINFSATFLSPSSHTTPPLIHPFHWFCQATKKTPLVHGSLLLNLSSLSHPFKHLPALAHSARDVQRFHEWRTLCGHLHLHSSAFHTFHTSCWSLNGYTNNLIHKEKHCLSIGGKILTLIIKFS